MTQQGERREPDEHDEPPAWWSQLYDENAGDTGRSATGDTLDDRFYSASRTLGGQRSLAPPEERSTADSASPEPRGTVRAPANATSDATSDAPSSATSDVTFEVTAGSAPRAEDRATDRTTGSATDRPTDPVADWSAPAGPDGARGTGGAGPSAPEGGDRSSAPTDDQRTLFLSPTGQGHPTPQRARDPREGPDPGRASAAATPTASATTPEGRPRTDDPETPVTDLRTPTTPSAPAPSAPEPAPSAPAPSAPEPAPSAPAPASPEPAPAPTPPTPAPSAPVSATVAIPRVTAPQAHPERSREPVPTAPHAPSPDAPSPHTPSPDALPPADPEDLAALVPDTVLEGARYGSATVRAVSARGAAARQAGAPRRDALLVARFGAGNDALVLVAVASGPPEPGRPATEGGATEPATTSPRVQAARAVCHGIADAVGRSHARLVEDIRAGRRGALKSGLQRLTGRGYGKLRAAAVERGVDPQEYTADLRCLLVSGDPECRIRVFFGVGSGGLFRLRDGHWQDIEPSVPPTAEAAAPAPGQPAAPPDPRTAPAAGPSTPAELAAADGFQPASAPASRPFRFRASATRPGDVLLLCGTGLAEPLRADEEFAHHLADRWAAGPPPDPADFLALTQRSVAGHTADRTAAAVWES